MESRNVATWYLIFCSQSPPSDPRGQNSTFSEQCHVAYQIKRNHKCSNMVANILPAEPPPPPPLPPSPLTLGLGSKGQYSTFSEHVHVAYQIKGNHRFSNIIVAKILPVDTTPPGDGVNRSKVNFFRTCSKGITKRSNMVTKWLKLYRLVYFFIELTTEN